MRIWPRRRRRDDLLHSWQQLAEASERDLAFARGEIYNRRSCLIGARDDLAALTVYEARDGGVWVRTVATERLKLLELAIEQTDEALARLRISPSPRRTETADAKRESDER